VERESAALFDEHTVDEAFTRAVQAMAGTPSDAARQRLTSRL